MPTKQHFKNILQNSTLAFLVVLLLSCGQAPQREANQENTPAKTSRQWQSPLQQEHPLTGFIFNTSSGQTVSEAELVQALNNKAYVLIGEKHDNPDHHLIQAELLQNLLTSKAYDQVVFEMLNDGQHKGLASLNQTDTSNTTNTSHTTQTIQDALKWDKQKWDWTSYGPLFEIVLNQHTKLTAGNVNKAMLMQVYSQGAKALQPPERFASAPAIDQANQDIMLEHIYINHCEMMPKEQLGNMLTVQIAKDASMAYALSQQESGILIAGAYHTQKNLGIPKHLEFMNKPEVVVLALTEVDADKASLSDYKIDADFVWFTPQFTDKDYCEDMKKQLQKKHAQ